LKKEKEFEQKRREILQKERQEAHNKAYKEKYPDYERNHSLKKKYGISLEIFNQMLEVQKGLCAICNKPELDIVKATGKTKPLSVDHCHAKGHVRALLCRACNHGLGNFKDNPDLLLAAAAYLTKYEKEPPG